MSDPLISVAVSSRNRPLRLRWMLNALAEQTLARDRFEVVVAHDSSSPETEELLRTHTLAAAGTLRALQFADGSVLAGAKRNAAWRVTRGELIAFTDDDCRPAPDWLERALARARAYPGAIVQGRTVPDPEESATLLGAPWARTQRVEPVTLWAETCNIAYPRALLETVGGFDEEMLVGEDTDLALRAMNVGASIVAAPDMLVRHAVEERWLWEPFARSAAGSNAAARQAPARGPPTPVRPDLVEARARSAGRPRSRCHDCPPPPQSVRGRPVDRARYAPPWICPPWPCALSHRAARPRHR